MHAAGCRVPILRPHCRSTSGYGCHSELDGLGKRFLRANVGSGGAATREAGTRGLMPTLRDTRLTRQIHLHVEQLCARETKKGRQATHTRTVNICVARKETHGQRHARAPVSECSFAQVGMRRREEAESTAAASTQSSPSQGGTNTCLCTSSFGIHLNPAPSARLFTFLSHTHTHIIDGIEKATTGQAHG